MAEVLDPKTEELVGIAAAVAGHCQPCFAHHYKEAFGSGVPVEAIQAAVELARAVRSAGDRHMDEYVTRRMSEAVVAGAFMYFATLTEVPILEGLLRNGMGQGPALTLLLAGPALSLPNMLVLGSLMGARKTVAYVTLVVIMASITGMIYGAFAV